MRCLASSALTSGEGNIQQLCVARHTPPEQWWPFITCESFGSLGDVGKIEYAKECAKTVKIPWVDSGVQTCVEGNEGNELLQNSVARSKAAEIHTSCTITVQDKVRCVHDGAWRNCEVGVSSTTLIAGGTRPVRLCSNDRVRVQKAKLRVTNASIRLATESTAINLKC